MRILIYQLKLSGGSGKAAVEYCEAFLDHGHEVEICFGVSQKKLRSRVETTKAKIHDLGVSRSIFSARRLGQILRFKEFDMVFLNGGLNVIPILLLRLLGRFIPHFVVVREVNSPKMLVSAKGWASSVYRLALRSAYRQADIVIALTHAMRDELMDDFGVSSGKLLVIPNWTRVDTHLPRSAAPYDNEIVFLGRLDDQKNPLLLIRSLSILHERAKFKLTMIGDGPMRHEVAQEIEKHGLERSVEIMGYVTDPRPFLARAKVLVLSSKYEGFPNAILEAMSCGCPVVATNCATGPSELITTTDVGILVPNFDSRELSLGIEKALSLQWEPCNIYKRASDFSKERFDGNLRLLVQRVMQT